MTDKSTTELKQYVFVQPCACNDEPDAHSVIFKVGSQQFVIGRETSETKEDAEWFASMFVKALESVCCTAAQGEQSKDDGEPAIDAALIAELDWCIENGHQGPRSHNLLKYLRGALTAPEELIQAGSADPALELTMLRATRYDETHGITATLRNDRIEELEAQLGASSAGSAEQVSEREAFEKWAIPRCLNLPKRPDGEYASVTTQEAWDAWQARAALSAPERKVKELPPLPAPSPTHYRERGMQIERMEMYTSDQMLEYALAALNQQGEQAAAEWNPIETAPKDGTYILLGSRCGAWIGKYQAVYQSGYKPENPWSSMMLNHDHMREKWQTPTHWMPLPAAPSTAQKDGGME